MVTVLFEVCLRSQSCGDHRPRMTLDGSPPGKAFDRWWFIQRSATIGPASVYVLENENQERETNAHQEDDKGAHDGIQGDGERSRALLCVNALASILRGVFVGPPLDHSTFEQVIDSEKSRL